MSTPTSQPSPSVLPRIPPIVRPYISDKAVSTLEKLAIFVEQECLPADILYLQQLGTTMNSRFTSEPSILSELKIKAQNAGLWNLFLPKKLNSQGAGFTNLEYGLMAEILGKSRVASEATNCSPPDSGNMELLAKFGSDAQKKRWLQPLLNGEIRSAFLMTEPDVAASDASNIRLRIERDGEEWVLNGKKWWSSGIGDPRCTVLFVMGQTDPMHPDRHRRQSVVIVPISTPGIQIHRMLSVFGNDDAPHGHGQVTLSNVRVPFENMILGPGSGFEVVQGRLGPGRIHHVMRCIGASERVLDLMISRMYDPRKKPFGKPLHEHEIWRKRVARTRLEISAARLLVLDAAHALDMNSSFRSSHIQIAYAKIYTPQVLLKALDRAIQLYGAAGVSQDFPLANMWTNARTMRIVDGPDEVHLHQIAMQELRRAKNILENLEKEHSATKNLFDRYAIKRTDRYAWTLDITSRDRVIKPAANL